LDAVDGKNLSMRAVDRIIKVARTIADLEKNEYIRIEHLAEALSYRGLEDFISNL